MSALTEAEEALHRLLLGQAAVSFTDSNGERVEYARADVDKLSAYVAALRAGTARPSVFKFTTSKGLI